MMPTRQPTYRVAFVCLGNICRSPMAEVVARDRLIDAGLADRVTVFSRGTANYHVGEDAHVRTLEVLRAHGHHPRHAAAQITRDELASTPLVLALDRANERDLRALARTDERRARIRLLRSLDPAAGSDLEVPDPWGEPLTAYEHVYAMVSAAADGLVHHLRTDALPAWERAQRPRT